MFEPPRCPYRTCSSFAHPEPGFWRPHGSYRPKCRSRPVPRFRCKSCGRTFSRQTFRADYRDHKPHLNPELFVLLASGVGLRQSARNLNLSKRCTDLKARKIGRHVRRLNVNLLARLPAGSKLQLDEFETYEGRRNTRPLSVPTLIEKESRLVIWAESATIRPSGGMSEARKAAIAEDERRFGRRRDLSREALRRTLQRGAQVTSELEKVPLATDEKTSYPRLAREAFGAERLEHSTTSSKKMRTKWNPLFAINHTEAMARDLTGRLRRESWLVSKKRRYLDIALHVFIAYRNLVRRRFNEEEESPAQIVGWLPRRLKPREVLSWRQDHGPLSIHPLARQGEPVAAWRARVA